jgi:phosphatidylserine/phosphatidylglycerophosphate/cardiolipin synthase-like enzyme
MGLHRHWLCLAAAALLWTLPGRALGADRFCDPAFEDCRAPLLALIDNEQVGIDVAFWFMEDAYYSAALERAARDRKVKIRVIFDSEALPNEPVRQFVVDTLVNAGIPMREKVDSGINHWKLMIFADQKVVQFSGANHTAEAFLAEVKYSNYVDEVIYFTDDESLVNSFKRKFDDVWTSTSGMMANYANVTTIERHYPDLATSPIDP